MLWLLIGTTHSNAEEMQASRRAVLSQKHNEEPSLSCPASWHCKDCSNVAYKGGVISKNIQIQKKQNNKNMFAKLVYVDLRIFKMS